ncbi:beta-propeller domain-containing protein [Porticoccaceae bacterium]|nr:beta-propeller domain-containing protein [Porticoccaceae bacterium]
MFNSIYIFKKFVKKLGFIGLFSLISLPAFAEDSTLYVRLNDNPFASPFYIFSDAANGDAISVNLVKGSTYTFIRTDTGHPFNIGDAWKQANPDVVMTSNGTGGEVGGVASISNNEQLTLTIPQDFSASTLAYYCYAHSVMLAPLSVVEPIVFDTWDLDANGQTDALTDGLILLRYAFGLTGDTITNNAVATDSPMSALEIQNHLNQVDVYADVDGNGAVDALTDGLMVLRFLFGIADESLVKDTVSSGATRSSVLQISQYITSYIPGMAGQTLDQSTALLVPMASGEEFTTQFTQSYNGRYGAVAEMEDTAVDAMPTGDAAMEAGADASAGESFTTTYTLEEGVDEHDFVKYDGSHLFIAPSYSLYDDCCFMFEPMFMFDDAIEVGEEPAVADEPMYPIIPEIRTLKILATDSTAASTEQVAQIVIEDNKTIEGLYTTENQLVSIDTSGWWGMYGDVFMDPYTWRNQTVGLDVYDISEIPDNSATGDLHQPDLLWEFELDGGFVTSRKKGDIVYLIARHTPSIPGYYDYPAFDQAESNQSALEEVTSEDLLPKAYINNEPVDFLNSTDCLMINEDHDASTTGYGYPTMTLLVAVNVAEQTIENSVCYLESTNGVYVSQESIYFIQQEGWGDNSKSFIHKFDLDADLAYTGSGEVQGHLTGRGQLDFRINEHNGYVRVVTSQWTGDNEDARDHRLTVLQQSSDSYNLEQVSVLPNSANPAEIGKPNEALYGVRFFGNKLYLVTFEIIDPLYVIDLTNHQAPEIAGELEVPGFSDFLHPVNENLLLGLGQIEGKVKLELFNVSPANEPYSVEEIIIGDGLEGGWSHSPAQFNRNAFQYQQVDQSTDRFSVPVSISYSTADQGYVNENQLHLFRIGNKDQADSATLDNVGFMSGQSRGWWNNDRQRSFFHGESIFYINGETVFSSTWDEVATSTP